MKNSKELEIRLQKSKLRIRNLYLSLDEEFVELNTIAEEIQWLESEFVRQNEGHISGRKCGCGKVHPFTSLQRHDS